MTADSARSEDDFVTEAGEHKTPLLVRSPQFVALFEQFRDEGATRSVSDEAKGAEPQGGDPPVWFEVIDPPCDPTDPIER